MIWKPRAIVAAVVERDGKFLIIEETIRGRDVLTQPAGHLEPGESLSEAVVREVREETGWLFEPQALVGCYRWCNQDDVTQLRFTFCGEVTEHFPDQPLDDGIIAAHWMSRDELIGASDRLRTPLVMRCLDDYIAGQRHSLEVLCEHG